MGSNCINIASVYAPNEISARSQFFDNLVDCIDNEHDWIVGGDFNCNIDSEKTKDVSKIILRNVLNEKDLYDAWRVTFPEDPGYTHYHKATKQASRIDYLFFSPAILNNVTDVEVNPLGLSDHNIVFLKLEDSHTFHGQGRWMCNNSLLKDKDCSFRIEMFWKFWHGQKDGHDSLADWWEWGKTRTKEIIKEYGKEKSWKRKQQQNDLQKRYQVLINSPEGADAEDIKDLETQMKEYEINEWKKAQIRTRNTMKVEGEKPSKCFLHLEKKQVDCTKIDKILNAA